MAPGCFGAELFLTPSPSRTFEAVVRPARRRYYECGVQIREFQNLIRDTFHELDVNRGVSGNFVWFVEEVGELARAIRDGTSSRHVTRK